MCILHNRQRYEDILPSIATDPLATADSEHTTLYRVI